LLSLRHTWFVSAIFLLGLQINCLKGQLHLLKDKLSSEHDPVLSDLDSHDLVQAGILPAASAAIIKKPIRLSTIDNYQGEESDIVVVSLTRSNEEGDIGFMCAPERLNVLVSRARNALIMIGNAETFMNAKKGRDEWTRLFGNLKGKGWVYDGFPLRCEKHPAACVVARTVDDFDKYCPDGGCDKPWYVSFRVQNVMNPMADIVSRVVINSLHAGRIVALNNAIYLWTTPRCYARL
jgi:hypothetical protein